MTRPTVRWASTWSGPFWASSSMTKIAVSGHDLLSLTASTIRPSARSLLATQASGVNVPGVVPVVWSSPRLITMKRGRVPALSYSRNSLRKPPPARCRGRRRLERAVSRAGVADQAGHAPSTVNAPSAWLTRCAVLAVAAVRQPRAGAGVPEVARGGFRQVAVVVVVDPGPPRVGQGPVAGEVVGVVGHRRPGVAVGRDVAVAVEVVEQDELLGPACGGWA